VTYLRHAARHVHHTVADHIEAQLVTLGWTTVGQVPFNAAPISIKRSAGTAPDIAAGQVRISLGNEVAPAEEELGGPLASQEYPIFVDVFMDNETIALALASDIRDVLLGRIGGRRWLPVINQANDTEVPGWTLELDDVERIRPDHVLPMAWQVVKVTAIAYFPEVVG
jgi:hypothetical protein